ncbi:MAG: FkbM family methyltransferase [Candidatus Nanopelagicaceae bacterium]|nr:FkbM family methyltransferase [Candidatus Nanopelagicaceae bacterium]
MSNVCIRETPFGRFLTSDWDIVPREIGTGKFWDPHIKPVYDQYIKKDSICMDVGAHCGFHALYMSKMCKKVYAFEPQPYIFCQLCGNIFINDRRNIIALNLAAYDKECELTITNAGQLVKFNINEDGVDYLNCANSAGIALSPRAGSGLSMKAITIDSLNLPSLCLIKCDAQGSDLRVLMGARQTIIRCRPIIIFEYEEELVKIHNHTYQDHLDFFKSLETHYNIKKLDVRDHLCLPE